MRAMPKTLDTQGFSGLREEVVRSEGRPPRPPVLQEIVSVLSSSTRFGGCLFFLRGGRQARNETQPEADSFRRGAAAAGASFCPSGRSARSRACCDDDAPPSSPRDSLVFQRSITFGWCFFFLRGGVSGRHALRPLENGRGPCYNINIPRFSI